MVYGRRCLASKTMEDDRRENLFRKGRGGLRRLGFPLSCVDDDKNVSETDVLERGGDGQGTIVAIL